MRTTVRADDGAAGRSKRWWSTTGAATVVVALLAGACGGASGPGTDAAGTVPDAAASDTVAEEGPAVDGGKLVFAVAQETEGWNPHDNKWGPPGSLVGSAVLEPLATLDSDLNAVPWLATSWTPNATYDSWTIELRDGVTFSNGEPFDATAVKLNLDDLTTAPLSGFAWKPLFRSTEVVDADTVQVNFTQPFAAFPDSFLSTQTSLMLAPAMLTAEGRGTAAPIGTGPFTFESWTPGSSLTVVKNPTYWQEGLPHLDQIEFTVVGDATSAASALQSDDVDIAFTASMATVTQVPDTFTVLKDWGSAPGLAITNTYPEVDGKPNPMANEHARKALAYATDQEALATYIGPGVEIPSSPFPPSSKWGMEPDENGYVTHDLDKAKEEVAAYEAETGQSLATILSAPTGGDNDAIVQLLQSQWSEAGIDTTIESVEAATLIGKVVGGSYQVALIGMYSAPDPDQNWHYWTADNAKGPGSLNINFTQYTTPTMQANLVIGRESPDFKTRKAAYDEIVKEINGAAVNIWTYSTPNSVIANPRVHGLTTVADVPFGNYQPKTWIGELWLAG